MREPSARPTRPAGASRPAPRSSRRPFWQICCFGLGIAAALGVTLFVPGFAKGLQSLRARYLASGGKRAQPASGELASRDAVRAGGTWGDLTYTTIYLQRPDESFPPVFPTPQPIAWHFAARAEGEQLFAAAALTPAQRRTLADPKLWQPDGQGWKILPPVELVRDLGPAARQHLYQALARNGRNALLQHPIKIVKADFPQWLERSGLPADKQNLVRQLSLAEDQAVFFYDGQLLELLGSARERKLFAKAAAQVPALLVQLRITPSTDLEALLRYWGRGGRGQAMKPFLESLRQVPEGVSISVSFFFPAFARMRLYTYPEFERPPAEPQQDCFWTTMNFFNDAPDPRLGDPEFIQKTFASDYLQINGDWAFGDVVVLAEAGKAVHMCVYVADDVVFTKNGADDLEPWVLMRMPEMLARYASKDKPLEIHGYRRKAMAR